MNLILVNVPNFSRLCSHSYPSTLSAPFIDDFYALDLPVFLDQRTIFLHSTRSGGGF